MNFLLGLLSYKKIIFGLSLIIAIMSSVGYGYYQRQQYLSVKNTNEQLEDVIKNQNSEMELLLRDADKKEQIILGLKQSKIWYKSKIRELNNQLDSIINGDAPIVDIPNSIENSYNCIMVVSGNDDVTCK
jgi:uncharacterized protein YjaZ